MNRSLHNKRPAMPPTPQQIYDANYDIRYVLPERKRKRRETLFIDSYEPTFEFITEPSKGIPVVVMEMPPTNEDIDI